MPEISNFSNDLQNNSGFDDALADIERAMVRFEQILSRHGRSLSANRRNDSHREIKRTLSNILKIFTEGDAPRADSSGSGNIQKNNRFPASGGQLLADFAASLRKIDIRSL